MKKRITVLSVLLIGLFTNILFGQNKYTHRGYLGWVRDLSSNETVNEAWPSIKIDTNLTNDYASTLVFMKRSGLNEITLWGFYTARSWEPIIENTINADRKNLINLWISMAHKEGIKVLSGMGVYSWGFDKIISENPKIKCPCNENVMDPSQPESWVWQKKVLDYVIDNFSFDGISMQSADKGRCNCGLYAKYDDIEYHAIINNKAADYIRTKRPDYLIGIAGWGMDFSEPSNIPFLKVMTSKVDYLIDVGETALKKNPAQRQQIIKEIAPCSFGSIGSPNIEPIQGMERDRYFIPTIYRASKNLKELYADGGKACETYMRARANPGDEITVEVLAAMQTNITLDISATVKAILKDIYGIHDAYSLRLLEEIFKAAEEAYFINSLQKDIILVSDREITKAEIPKILISMNESQKTDYDRRMRDIYILAKSILPKVKNKQKLQLVIRCIGRTINDLVKLRGTGNIVDI